MKGLFMLCLEKEAPSAASRPIGRARRLFPYGSRDDANVDPFDIDVRIESSDERSPLERLPMVAGSIFGSCHSCRCTGAGCR
jgi:hypothetical protein